MQKGSSSTCRHHGLRCAGASEHLLGTWLQALQHKPGQALPLKPTPNIPKSYSLWHHG